MARQAVSKKIAVISVYGMKGYKDADTKVVRPGRVNVWAEVESFDLTVKEARKFAKMILKAADRAEKVGK